MHEREVLIRLKLESDPGSIAQISRGIQGVTQLTKGLSKTWEDYIAIARRGGRTLEDLTSYLNDTQRAEFKLHLEQRKRLAAMPANVKGVEEYARATHRSRLASERMAIQFQRTGAAALRATRGLMFFAASGDEDLQRMLRSLVKIQAAYDILSGVGATVAGLSRMMRSYTASVEAAAAAHTALAASQAVSGVSTVAGVSAGAGAGTAGFGIGAVVIGVVTALTALVATIEWAEVAIRKAAGKDPWGGPTTQMGGRVARWFTRSGISGTGLSREENLQRALRGEMGIPGFTQSYYQAEAQAMRGEKRLERMTAVDRVAKERVAAIRVQAATIREQMRGGFVTPQEGLMQARQQYAAAHLRQLGGRDVMLAQRIAAGQTEIAALQEMKRLDEERKRTVLARSRESMMAAKEELRTLHDQYKVDVKRLDLIRKERMTAEERFGALSPIEQERVLRAGERFKAGVGSREDERLIETYLGPGGQERLGKERRGRTGETRFGKVFGTWQTGEQKAAEAVRRITKEGAGLGFDLTQPIRELFAKIKVDSRASAEVLVDAIEKAIQKSVREMAEAQVRLIEDREAQRRAKDRQQVNAIGGG